MNPTPPDILLQSRIQSLLADFTRTPIERIHPRTTLFHDLGITGDDGWDFLLAFSQQFNIDMTHANHALHFGPERFLTLDILLELLLLKKRWKPIPLTLTNLTQIATTQKWPDFQTLPHSPVQ